MSNCPSLQIKNHDCEPLPPWKGKCIFKTKTDCWSWQILARQVQAWADGDDVWPLLASHVSSWRLPKQLFSFAPLLLFVWDARHDSSIWIFHAIKSAKKDPKGASVWLLDYFCPLPEFSWFALLALYWFVEVIWAGIVVFGKERKSIFWWTSPWYVIHTLNKNIFDWILLSRGGNCKHATIIETQQFEFPIWPCHKDPHLHVPTCTYMYLLHEQVPHLLRGQLLHLLRGWQAFRSAAHQAGHYYPSPPKQGCRSTHPEITLFSPPPLFPLDN